MIDYNKWHYYQKGIISSAADYENVKLSSSEVKELFAHFKGSFFIRYISDFDNGKEGNMWSVIRDGAFELEQLPSKTRNMVRRCLKSCEVKLVDYTEIVKDGGFNIYLSEYRRFQKKGFSKLPESEEKWIKGKQESASRGEEYWGVYNEGKLIAYGIVDIKGAEANLVTWKCNYEDNNNLLYPSYGLVYEMTHHYLNRGDIKYVNDGSRTLTQHSSVQDFLESKFGFRKAYCKLNVVFKWYVKIMVILISPFERFINHNGLLALIHMYRWSR